MIYLANSMRRQHCARLGIIILFKLNEDKGKTNLLSLCTIGQKRGIALSTFAMCHILRAFCVSDSRPASVCYKFHQIPVSGVKRPSWA